MRKGTITHRKALFVFIFIGNVDEEGHNGGMTLHELHHKVQAQMHTLTDQALVPRCTAADQPVQGFHHHLTLSLVSLPQSNSLSSNSKQPCSEATLKVVHFLKHSL